MSKSMVLRDNVTTRTQKAFAYAHDLADQLGHSAITSTHFTIGVLREGMSAAAQVLIYGRGLAVDALEAELLAEIPSSGSARVLDDASQWTKREWTPSAVELLDAGALEASEMGSEAIASEHVLLSILRDTSSVPARILSRHGVGYAEFMKDLRQLGRT
jgi:ATP-dependent Clp protease ATP-binding subunit ClpC